MNEFWMDHIAACADCLTGVSMNRARADEWRTLDGKPLPYVASVDPFMLRWTNVLCWRCERDRRARTIGMSEF